MRTRTHVYSCIEPGARKREPGAGSREPGAGNREPGAGRREGSQPPAPAALGAPKPLVFLTFWGRAARKLFFDVAENCFLIPRFPEKKIVF